MDHHSTTNSTGYGPSDHDALTQTESSTIYTIPNTNRYSHYPALDSERKSAREFPDEIRTPSFTDLPAETRLIVYSFLDLRAPNGFFELWGPMPWAFNKDHDDAKLIDKGFSNSFQLYARVAQLFL